MNLYLRLLITLIFRRTKTSSSLLEEIETSFTVLPTDLDPNMHMNNGVYLSIMDLARIDYSYRSQIFKAMKELQCYPVVASQTIRYQRSLLPFRKFKVHTKILGWDDRFVYVRQIFRRNQEVVSFAVVKARFLSKNGPISPHELVGKMDSEISSPGLPDWIEKWTSAEDGFWTNLKSEAPQ